MDEGGDEIWLTRNEVATKSKPVKSITSQFQYHNMIRSLLFLKKMALLSIGEGEIVICTNYFVS